MIKRISAVVMFAALIVAMGLSVDFEPRAVPESDKWTTDLTVSGDWDARLPVIYRNEAYAGSTGFAAPTAVSVSKMWSAPYSRVRISVVDADTTGAKIDVPGMAAGDYILSVSYDPWDSLGHTGAAATRVPLDLTDSSYFSGDTLAIYDDDGDGIFGGATQPADSGHYYILWNDATD